MVYNRNQVQKCCVVCVWIPWGPKMNNKMICPVMTTIAMVSDKWKVLILYHLRDGKKRFNELRRALQGVTQRVLTHQLRALEADGLIIRTIYAEVPPRVEYELTELGRTLIPVLDKLEEWARQNSDKLMATRTLNATKLPECKELSDRKELSEHLEHEEFLEHKEAI